MSERCNVCGEKFGKFRAAKVFQFDSHCLELCGQCHEKACAALAGPTDPNNAMAVHSHNVVRRYFIEAIEKGSCDSDLLPAIEALAGITEEEKRAAEERKASVARAEELFYRQRESVVVSTAPMLSTHTVKAYHGVLAATATVGSSALADLMIELSDAMGSSSSVMESSVDSACKAALERLVKKAVFAGGNGVLGVAYSVFVLDSNMVGVTASGTAVTLEEIA